MFFLLNLFSVMLFHPVSSVTVVVQQGTLRGLQVQSVYNNVTYYSFKGIPYAKPPLGSLRFKAPEPPESWEGIRDATQHGSVCIQYNMDAGKNEGSEDCLFLNVYTPDLNPNCPLPVIFFIHGGLYERGSGNDDAYGPDILVAQGVVVVTITYRLAVLGFLQLDILEVPGNAGLKDQVAAMQWVQKNIKNFGGDPNQVTIMGQSSGSSCVGLHLLSPLSKGLFQRAILASGVPLNDFSTSFECTRKAFILGTQLGIHTRDPYELLDFLQTVPADRFLNLNVSAIITESMLNTLQKSRPFVPCPEICGNNNFFTGNILNYLDNKNIANQVDIIIGHNSIEFLAYIYQYEEIIFQSYPNYTDLFVPSKMLFQINPQQAIQVTDRIISYYFGEDLIIPANVQDMLQYLDSETFIYDIYRFINYLPTCMKKYVYIMEAQSERNVYGNAASAYYGIGGTVHMDDLNYLFQPKAYSPPLVPGSQEYNLVTEYSRAFTNFIKYGNPGVSCWRPYNINERNAVKFVNNFSPCTLDFTDYKFWQKTYNLANVRF